jgi:uncharacterized protein involved in outer membrane biogenesis
MKKLIIFFVVLMALLVGGLFYISNYWLKDKLITEARNILRTQVTSGEISLSLGSGTLSLKDVIFENIEPNDSRPAFEAGEIFIKFRLMSVFGNAIEIYSVNVINPQLNVELTAIKTNVDELADNALIKNIEAEDAILVSVDELLLTDGKARLILTGAMAEKTKPQEFVLKNIRLSDFGTQDAPVHVGFVIGKVLKTLQKSMPATIDNGEGSPLFKKGFGVKKHR